MSQQFSIPRDGTGQITRASDPSRCLQVAGTNVPGTHFELAGCQSTSPTQKFLVPDMVSGDIRWGPHVDKCLQIVGTAVQLQYCPASADVSFQFHLPQASSRVVRPTTYVTHYLPWFLGKSVDPACKASPDCSYANDHWCSNSYGNSFYASYMGAYDITQPGVIDKQLDIMKQAGIQGLWIDYQSPNWNGVINTLISGTKARGMGFAIMFDSAISGNIMAQTASTVAAWTQQPHYYRHQGFPIVLVFNDVYTHFAPLPVSAIYLSGGPQPLILTPTRGPTSGMVLPRISAFSDT